MLNHKKYEEYDQPNYTVFYNGSGDMNRDSIMKKSEALNWYDSFYHNHVMMQTTVKSIIVESLEDGKKFDAMSASEKENALNQGFEAWGYHQTSDNGKNEEVDNIVDMARDENVEKDLVEYMYCGGIEPYIMASIIDDDMELFYDDRGFDGYRNSYISIGSVPQWDDETHMIFNQLEITGECSFNACGIKYGMPIEEALSIAKTEFKPWTDGQDRVHEGDDGNYYIDIGAGPTYMTFQEKNGYVSRIYYLFGDAGS